MLPDIRPYGPRDLAQVTAVWEAALAAGEPKLDAAYLSDERAALSEVYLPQSETWVAETSEVVGFVSLLGTEIGGLFVTPRAQRHGIGTALVALVSLRRHRLSVEVFEANHRARWFYTARGFRRAGHRVHPETGLGLLRLARD